MSQKTFLEQFKSLSYRQITRLPPFPHVFSASEVGLIRVWIMGYQGIMGFSPYPKSGKAKLYGLLQVMGFQEYGLEGFHL